MNTVIVFEVSDHHTEVRTELLGMGYMSAWMAGLNNTVRYNLPSSMLWKVNIPLEQGSIDVESAIRSVNTRLSLQIRLFRCISLGSFPWNGIVGTPIP